MRRRDFIKLGAASGVFLGASPNLMAKTENITTHSNKKIVWLILRGAMDSLHAVVPTFDKHLVSHRASLVEPIIKKLNPLARGFGLHPALENCYELYKRKQFLPIVAVSSPYRERSHFDAQDMLESGLNQTDYNSGWLARAFEHYGGDALAIARSVPISLRGKLDSRTWYPSTLKDAEPDLYERLSMLYDADANLQKRLQQGVETRSMMSMDKKKNQQSKFVQLATNCGELMSNNSNASCAMLEMGGWDTHNNLVNRLNTQFKQLDAGLAALQSQLKDQWTNTVVIVATEFGRTVAVNGTRGTDHGTASALFLAGGGINGGQVLGDWPGLAEEELYEKRDLAPTSDLRAWLATLLQQHWALSAQQLPLVFPDTKMVDKLLIKPPLG